MYCAVLVYVHLVQLTKSSKTIIEITRISSVSWSFPFKW